MDTPIAHEAGNAGVIYRVSSVQLYHTKHWPTMFNNTAKLCYLKLKYPANFQRGKFIETWIASLKMGQCPVIDVVHIL